MTYKISNYIPRAFHRNTEFWNAELKDLDLSTAEFPYIPVLHRLGSATQEQLSYELAVHKSAVTKTVRSLEKKGLIERKKDASDMRCNRIVLTQKGEDYWEITQACRKRWDQVALQGLSKEEIEVAERVLMKVIENIEGEKKYGKESFRD